MKYAWEWKEKHGGIILEQLKKLGASCDWERTRFTLDESMYESVIRVFLDLHEKGLIYRGVRMINWDPKALTAISDEEVIYKEVESKLYYVRYKIEGSEDEWLTIATTRPETILGDTAVCVNPGDERYHHLKGRNVIVPLVNRSVPVIQDEYVDMEFGTGCLKITPAHDINDYEIGLKFNLKVIDIFNDDGTLSEKAELFIGQDRFEARKNVTEELKEKGHIVKIDNYINKVGYSERTTEVIEPKLSLQWFMNMKDMAKPALDVVMNDTVRFFPAKYKNTYRHWMENVRDWCISRQLWWGQRIPAYYLPDGRYVVAGSEEEALVKANEISETRINREDLRQDEDVLDTWFSSWLWPISVFDGIRNPDNDDINYYYPTNDLITGPDILFFWVARMIMAGQEYRKDIPFKNVYLTGMVRDKQGRKMSKSLGNSPDPIELINQFGADGTRVGMLLTSPAGNDLLFDEALCEQGRNFSNKIWNALRLVKSWKIDDNRPVCDACEASVKWFEAKLHESMALIEDHYTKYRISDALMAVYKLIWDDFCSWYLEMIKPAFGEPVCRQTYDQTIRFFEVLMQILHPFMPFITEEIWHHLNDRKEEDCVMISRTPASGDYDKILLDRFDIEKEVIIAIRNLRQEKGIPNKEKLTLLVKKNYSEQPDTFFDPILIKLCGLNELKYVEDKPEGAIPFVVKSTEFFVPLGSHLDVEAELGKLQTELEYTKGFLTSTMKKLSNERFVNNAPEKVVAMEQKKKDDAEAKIKVLEEQIKALKG